MNKHVISIHNQVVPQTVINKSMPKLEEWQCAAIVQAAGIIRQEVDKLGGEKLDDNNAGFFAWGWLESKQTLQQYIKESVKAIKEG